MLLLIRGGRVRYHYMCLIIKIILTYLFCWRCTLNPVEEITSCFVCVIYKIRFK
jgi:hypothetical protein